jgi:hypothetical protein
MSMADQEMIYLEKLSYSQPIAPVSVIKEWDSLSSTIQFVKTKKTVPVEHYSEYKDRLTNYINLCALREKQCKGATLASLLGGVILMISPFIVEYKINRCSGEFLSATLPNSTLEQTCLQKYGYEGLTACFEEKGREECWQKLNAGKKIWPLLGTSLSSLMFGVCALKFGDEYKTYRLLLQQELDNISSSCS